MGPIASFAQREHIARQVDDARAAGARVLIGGAAPLDARLAVGAF
jgi:acyl-CoA reductase-like NAD-dependent aldehyde dehydrogenase